MGICKSHTSLSWTHTQGQQQACARDQLQGCFAPEEWWLTTATANHDHRQLHVEPVHNGGTHIHTRRPDFAFESSRTSLWGCPREQSSLRQTGSQCADVHCQVALFLIRLEVFCICSSHLLSAESPEPARLVSWPDFARPGKMLL